MALSQVQAFPPQSPSLKPHIAHQVPVKQEIVQRQVQQQVQQQVHQQVPQQQVQQHVVYQHASRTVIPPLESAVSSPPQPTYIQQSTRVPSFPTSPSILPHPMGLHTTGQRIYPQTATMIQFQASPQRHSSLPKPETVQAKVYSFYHYLQWMFFLFLNLVSYLLNTDIKQSLQSVEFKFLDHQNLRPNQKLQQMLTHQWI